MNPQYSSFRGPSHAILAKRYTLGSSKYGTQGLMAIHRLCGVPVELIIALSLNANAARLAFRYWWYLVAMVTDRVE
jgi:hypothetical protein